MEQEDLGLENFSYKQNDEIPQRNKKIYRDHDWEFEKKDTWEKIKYELKNCGFVCNQTKTFFDKTSRIFGCKSAKNEASLECKALKKTETYGNEDTKVYNNKFPHLNSCKIEKNVLDRPDIRQLITASSGIKAKKVLINAILAVNDRPFFRL